MQARVGLAGLIAMAFTVVPLVLVSAIAAAPHIGRFRKNWRKWLALCCGVPIFIGK